MGLDPNLFHANMPTAASPWNGQALYPLSFLQNKRKSQVISQKYSFTQGAEGNNLSKEHEPHIYEFDSEDTREQSLPREKENAIYQTLTKGTKIVESDDVYSRLNRTARDAPEPGGLPYRTVSVRATNKPGLPSPPSPGASSKVAEPEYSQVRPVRASSLDGAQTAFKHGKKQWFHGRISREEAERRLCTTSSRFGERDGIFLVREKEAAIRYAISVLADGKCRHFLVERSVRKDGTHGSHFVLNDKTRLRGCTCIADVVQLLSDPSSYKADHPTSLVRPADLPKSRAMTLPLSHTYAAPARCS